MSTQNFLPLFQNRRKETEKEEEEVESRLLKEEKNILPLNQNTGPKNVVYFVTSRPQQQQQLLAPKKGKYQGDKRIRATHAAIQPYMESESLIEKEKWKAASSELKYIFEPIVPKIESGYFTYVPRDVSFPLAGS